MHRIDTTTAGADVNGAGKSGFIKGNPAIGVKSTRFSAEWTNAVQEEIAGVIEAAGTALNKAANNQLLAAIGAMINAASVNLAGYARLAVANVWTKPQTPAATALADTATVAWDASLGNLFTLTLTAARTLGAPTGLVANTSYRLVLTTGGFTPSWNTVFKFQGGSVPSGLSGVCIFDFHSPDGAQLYCTGYTVNEA